MDNPWLDNALELQKVDLQIRDYNTRLATIPSQIATLQKTIKDVQQLLDNEKKALQTLEVQLKEIEDAIAKQDQIVIKMLANSSMIRKQDEYNAALEEIKQSKKKKDELETTALEIIDLIEEKQHSNSVLKESTQDQCEIANAEIEDLKGIEAELQSKISKLTETRQAQAKLVNAEVLSIYERLLKRGKGIPLARITNFVCDNCHMRVTQQAVNDATRGDITFCGNCSHLLYLKD